MRTGLLFPDRFCHTAGMKASTPLWIGLVVVAINGLVSRQELLAWRHAPGGTIAFPFWTCLTLAGAVVYLLTAGILFDRARRGRR